MTREYIIGSRLVGVVLICLGIHFGLGNLLALIIFGCGLCFYGML